MARPKTPVDDLTREQAAALAGITSQALSLALNSAYPPPRNDAGNYPLRAFGEWLAARAIRNARADYRPDQPDANDLRREKDIQSARKDAALAEKAEIENGVRRGELVEAAEVVAGWQIILGRVKTRILQIPSIAAPLIVAETDQHSVQEILADYVRDALTELSAPEAADELSDEE
jgi:phage terminase Nu1 subunit (DNA packaging protein)